MLARGESVAGGLGKRPDMEAMLREAGIGPDLMMKRIRLIGSLTKAECETLLDDAHMKRVTEAGDKASDREARRIIRARE